MKKTYLLIPVTTSISLFILSLTIWKLPPQDEYGDIIIKNLLIASISTGISFTNILTIPIYAARRIFETKALPEESFKKAYREALFVSLTIGGLFVFHKTDILNILNAILLILIFISLEVYFVSRERT